MPWILLTELGQEMWCSDHLESNIRPCLLHFHSLLCIASYSWGERGKETKAKMRMEFGAGSGWEQGPNPGALKSI